MKCSMCGALGVNKGTCPLNNDATNVRPRKHQVGGGQGLEVAAEGNYKRVYIKTYSENDGPDDGAYIKNQLLGMDLPVLSVTLIPAPADPNRPESHRNIAEVNLSNNGAHILNIVDGFMFSIGFNRMFVPYH